MIKELNRYVENELEVIEYSKDGKTVSHIVKRPLSNEIVQNPKNHDPKTTVEDIAEENLLETKYQTLLLEMML